MSVTTNLMVGSRRGGLGPLRWSVHIRSQGRADPQIPVVPLGLATPTVAIDGSVGKTRRKEGAMAVNAEVQTLPRKGTSLSPFGMLVLSVMLAAAVVMGVLVGRWTAPSTAQVRQAEITAPGWTGEASATNGEAYVPGVTDFPSFGSTRQADPYVPGVTDFPSYSPTEHAGPFVPGVTDFGS
jgi:hypothetical protein